MALTKNFYFYIIVYSQSEGQSEGETVMDDKVDAAEKVKSHLQKWVAAAEAKSQSGNQLGCGAGKIWNELDESIGMAPMP